MVKLAKLFFLIFSTASPKPFFLFLNNNNSSMDMEVNPKTSPVVLLKSNTLPIKTSSFSTKLNPLPIKLPIFKEPLSARQVGSRGVGPTLPQMDMEVNPKLVITLFGFLLLGLLPILLLLLYVLRKHLADCVKQLCLQCTMG